MLLPLKQQQLWLRQALLLCAPPSAQGEPAAGYEDNIDKNTTAFSAAAQLALGCCIVGPSERESSREAIFSIITIVKEKESASSNEARQKLPDFVHITQSSAYDFGD